MREKNKEVGTKRDVADLLDSKLIAAIFLINLITYLSVHLPIDVLTYKKRREKQKSDSVRPPAYKKKHVMVIIALTSIYFWLLFLFIPFSGDLTILYYFSIPIAEPLGTGLAFIGLVIICSATFIACLGRISRGTSAISWGVPARLEKTKMFRLIRHPLYASYIYYFIGLSLIFQSSVVFPLLLGIYGYYQSSIYEEEILIEYFGDEYLEYQKKTGRFFPKISI
ncbi:MAG: methyltransferase family protein [Candidatus Hodarchaeales archaeon]